MIVMATSIDITFFCKLKQDIAAETEKRATQVLIECHCGRSIRNSGDVQAVPEVLLDIAGWLMAQKKFVLVVHNRDQPKSKTFVHRY